jgi:hypothetical protein
MRFDPLPYPVNTRLRIYSPEHKMWLHAALPINATDWDAEQFRTQYRARGYCTAWVKRAA